MGAAVAGSGRVMPPRIPLAPARSPEDRVVPPRALVISLMAFAVPVVAVLSFPDFTNAGFGTLVWLPALIPAFLLAYYRGLRGVAVALAGGMAVITATQVSVVAFDIAEPNWSLLLAIVLVYLVVSIGIAVLAEALNRERRSAEDMALVDRLTGLPNRRQLDVALETAFAAAERGHPITVVVFDLDHFKRVNDTHGHAAGDDALRQFGEVLRDNTRGQDLSARFGGEEFVSVLRASEAASATVFAERVLHQMRERQFAWGRQTVSAGIAVHQPGMGSYEVLLAAADRALYTSKSEGRDRVTTAAEFAVPTPESTAIVTPMKAGEATPSKERLFVVDDDREVRESVRLALAGEGYDVWETDDPKEAIRHFAAVGEARRPAAIVTDVIMPGMTGMTMIDQITAITPAVRVIYMSGYVHGPVSWAGAPGAVVAFLDKPFTVNALLSTVDEVLHRALEARLTARP